MRITHLNATNFRNYRSLEIDLLPHITIIQGDNAQGKTNLLEAIHVLAITRSHRTSSEKDLINRFALEEVPVFSRLCAFLTKWNDEYKIEMLLRLDDRLATDSGSDHGPASGASVRKSVKVNEAGRRASDYVGFFNTVMFSAGDIDLVTGTPGVCRRYLDMVISQTAAGYLRKVQRYNRVLTQRNHLLRQMQDGRSTPEQLEFWDRELVDNGSYIVVQRRHLVEQLNSLAPDLHRDLSGGVEEMQIEYLASTGAGDSEDKIKTDFRRRLEQSRRKEVSQGVTLTGPHRDNLQFLVNGTGVSRYGSRGQQQTVALAVKLAEARYMHGRAGEAPVLLLDDVFSELDGSRRRHLLEAVTSFQQVLITTVDMGCFTPSFLSAASLYKVRDGDLSKV